MRLPSKAGEQPGNVSSGVHLIALATFGPLPLVMMTMKKMSVMMMSV